MAWTAPQIERFVRSYQAIRNLTVDGWAGKATTQDAATFLQSNVTGARWNAVKASSFADPEDIQAFQACKKEGHSDDFCFGVGDNGIGAWGHNTAGDIPMVALPPDDWKGNANGGDTLQLRYKTSPAFPVLLGDTMPAKRNIRNGAGIDINPAALAFFCKEAPILEEGFSWAWMPSEADQLAGFIDGLGLKYFTGKEIGTYWSSTRNGVTNSVPPRDLWPNCKPLFLLLDTIRTQAGHPVKLNSTYRSPAYNKAVGGVTNSQHLQFKAADITCDALGVQSLHRLVKGLRDKGVFKGGIGKYATFVHVDVRGTNADWNG